MATASPDTDQHLKLTVEFRGGAELLFGNEKLKQLQLSGDRRWDVRQLIEHLKTDHLKEREELFCQSDSVRPGILVLVNDTDWELLGELDCQLSDGDRVLFISTLHGG